MHASNDVDEVKHFTLLGLIAVSILEDGRVQLGKYMAEAGYPNEREQLIGIVSVEVKHEEPTLVVKFNFRGDEPGSVEEGKFFIWINDNETIGGDF